MPKRFNQKNTAADHTDAACMPTQSMSATAAGFKAGIGHLASKGVFEVPNGSRNTVEDTAPGVWSPGSVKPNC